MKKNSTIILQIVIVFIGIGALALVLSAPLRNTGPTLFEKYFNTFVAFTYAATIPFFVALFQAFKLLGYIGRNEIFSPGSVRALRNIKYCALTFIGFVAVSVLFMIGGDPEDRPPGTVMRIILMIPSVFVATAATIFGRIFEKHRV